MSCIYLLTDPLTNEVRYVGKTKLKLPDRLSGHITEARRKPQSTCHRLAWLRSLLQRGLVPRISKDCDVPKGVDWQVIEQIRIQIYRSLGYRLVNGTDGGDGPSEYTPESRARMSLASKARMTPESLALWETYRHLGTLANRGSKRSPEFCAHRAMINRTRSKPSQETREKMSAAQREAWAKPGRADRTAAAIRRNTAPEYREKMRAVWARPGFREKMSALRDRRKNGVASPTLPL